MPLTPPNSRARARTNVAEINADLVRDLSTVRNHLGATANAKVREAWVEVETFCAIAVRVMAASNPSKVRECARAVEIAHLMREKK